MNKTQIKNIEYKLTKRKYTVSEKILILAIKIIEQKQEEKISKQQHQQKQSKHQYYYFY